MSRRTVTRPEVRVDGQWVSSIAPAWGELRTSTRANGPWECSWTIVAPHGWRHPALRYGAPVEVHLGPNPVWVGTLDEPDWDSGQMVALGAGRDGDDAISLNAAGKATTKPNVAIDQAIARGVLPWTRVDDFGTTAVGQDEDQGGLVKLTSVLDAWADENGSEWRVDNQRRLVHADPAPTAPSWHVMPGSGDLGQAADRRADRIFVRYVSTATGRLATASYPASTPAGGIEAAVDVTDRGQMSATKAANIAEARWNVLQGESGWTNGLTLTNGQVTTPGGVVADLSQVRAGQTIRLLGVRDPRNGGFNLDVVIGDTEYDWAEDTIQVNPVGMAARTEEAVLEQVTELASDAIAATGGAGAFAPVAATLTRSTDQTVPNTWTRIAFNQSDVVGNITVNANGTVTINQPGIYALTASTALTAGGSKVVMRIQVNDSGATASSSDEGSGFRYLSCAATVSLEAGDVLDVDVNHGQSPNTDLSSAYTAFGLFKVPGT